MIKDKTNHIGIINIIYLREIQRNRVSDRLTERKRNQVSKIYGKFLVLIKINFL